MHVFSSCKCSGEEKCSAGVKLVWTWRYQSYSPARSCRCITTDCHQYQMHKNDYPHLVASSAYALLSHPCSLRDHSRFSLSHLWESVRPARSCRPSCCLLWRRRLQTLPTRRPYGHEPCDSLLLPADRVSGQPTKPGGSKPSLAGLIACRVLGVGKDLPRPTTTMRVDSCSGGS